MARPVEILPSALAILRRGETPKPPVDTKVIRSVDDLPLVRDRSDLEIEYLIEPELPQNAVVALTGDSGSGKSSLALWWAGKVTVKGHPVLVLDRENPRPVIAERLTRFKIEDGEMLRYWGGWAREESPAPYSPIVVDWLKRCERPPMIIVDSLIAFHGGNENDASETRAFMHQARRLADLGATVLVLHHDGKADSAKDYRGSSDFKASLDLGFHVSNSSLDGRLSTLRLRCFKARFGSASEVIYRYAADNFHRDGAENPPRATASERLTALLRRNPGIGTVGFETLAQQEGITRERAREFITDGLLSRTIRREPGTRNRRKFYLEGQ